jgi:hypothetical protein
VSKMMVKVFVITILVTLVVIEVLPIPYAQFYGPTPQFYQVLANDHSNYSVIEVPIQNPVQSLYLYYQSAYNAPLVDGSIPRSPQYPSMIIQTAPFIEQLGYYSPGKAPPSDIINQTYPLMTLAPYILAQYNVKYIIVHKDLFNSPTGYLPYVEFLTPLLGQPIYQDSAIVAFRFIAPPNTGIVQFLRQYNNISLVSLLYGNWLRFGVFGTHVRAMSGFGGLDVFSGTNRTMQLQFKVAGVGQDYPLQLLVNGQVQGTYMAFQGVYNTYSTAYFTIHAGENQIFFLSPTGCNVPSPATARNLASSSASSNNCVTATFKWIDPVAAYTTIQT